MTTRAAGAVAALLLSVAPSPARAHDAGVSYGELTIRGSRVEASLRIAAADAAAAMGVERPQDARALEREGLLIRATLGTFAVEQGGVGCPFEPGAAQPEPPDGLRVTGSFRCGDSGERLRVSAGLLGRVPWGHTLLAKVVAGDHVEEHVLRAGRETFEVDAPASWLTQAARFLRLGVEHILTGYDHVAFLLGLLLLGGTLRGLVKVVTSFTAAHSVTLALASLGIVSLPTALVEPVIAASIVFVGVENLLELRRPSPRAEARRWRLGFAFGLVHGFGFAGALSELHLSTAGLATALLSFNAGVELGQAAIVAAAYPMLVLLRRRPLPAMVSLRVGSLAIGAAGLFWLVERVPWLTTAPH